MIRVTVWNEYLHEKEEPVRHIYPNGIHGCIKEFLQTDEELVIKTATFEMPEHGLTDEVLAQTDVLIFWSHMRQNEFSDEVAARVCSHVRQGMGKKSCSAYSFSYVLLRLTQRHRQLSSAPNGMQVATDVYRQMMLYLANNNNSGHTDWTQPSGLYRNGSYLYLNNGKNNYNNYYYEPSYSTEESSTEESSSSSSSEENPSKPTETSSQDSNNHNE